MLNPEKIKIEKAPKLNIKIELHPDAPKKGFRKFNTHDEFYIEDKLEKNTMYRLMHLFNFENSKFHSIDHKKELNAKLIHWLPVSKDLVNVEVIMPDNSILIGTGEPSIRYINLGDIVQFIRFGFCKLGKKEKDKLVFYYSHR
ncbi:hypothetical protein HYX16_00480 [Candidatus Woesearchaeota archaeon]|nr:hypothetical protein [Candidatus Woesearchaeota archaeon]